MCAFLLCLKNDLKPVFSAFLCWLVLTYTDGQKTLKNDFNALVLRAAHAHRRPLNLQRHRVPLRSGRTTHPHPLRRTTKNPLIFRAGFFYARDASHSRARTREKVAKALESRSRLALKVAIVARESRSRARMREKVAKIFNFLPRQEREVRHIWPQ